MCGIVTRSLGVTSSMWLQFSMIRKFDYRRSVWSSTWHFRSWAQSFKWHEKKVITVGIKIKDKKLISIRLWTLWSSWQVNYAVSSKEVQLCSSTCFKSQTCEIISMMVLAGSPWTNLDPLRSLLALKRLDEPLNEENIHSAPFVAMSGTVLRWGLQS